MIQIGPDRPGQCLDCKQEQRGGGISRLVFRVTTDSQPRAKAWQEEVIALSMNKAKSPPTLHLWSLGWGGTRGCSHM